MLIIIINIFVFSNLKLNINFKKKTQKIVFNYVIFSRLPL